MHNKKNYNTENENTIKLCNTSVMRLCMDIDV